MVQLVLRPVSCLLRPLLSVKVLKIMSPFFMQIIVMSAVCAKIVNLAPLVTILDVR